MKFVRRTVAAVLLSAAVATSPAFAGGLDPAVGDAVATAQGAVITDASSVPFPVPILVGDLDGDGVRDVARTFSQSRQDRVELRDGVDGSLQWSRLLPTDNSGFRTCCRTEDKDRIVYPARVGAAGEPGLYVVTGFTVPVHTNSYFGQSLELRESTLVVQAFDGVGANVWTATLADGMVWLCNPDYCHTQLLPDGSSDAAGVLQANPGPADEVLIRLRTPAGDRAVVLDGADGAMSVRGAVAGSVRPTFDHDLDGFDEYRSSSEVYSGRTGAVLFSARGSENVGDVTGDGSADHTRRSYPVATRIELVNGADQSIVWSRTGPEYSSAIAGDVDGDGLGDVRFVTKTSSAMSYVAVAGNGTELFSQSRAYRAGAIDGGDLDADGVTDWLETRGTSGSNVSVAVVSGRTGHSVASWASEQNLFWTFLPLRSSVGGGPGDDVVVSSGQLTARGGTDGALLWSSVTVGLPQVADDVNGDGVVDVLTSGGRAAKMHDGASGAVIWAVA